MGSSSAKIGKIKQQLAIDLKNWKKQKQRGLTDYYLYVGNDSKISGLEAQLASVEIDPRFEQPLQWQIYSYRKTTKESIVKCYGAEAATSSSSIICGEKKFMRVLTESMVKVFPEFPTLDLPETVYVLRQSLSGYQALYNQLGQFQISEAMMGLNSLGEFKVWCNEKFAYNHPSHEKSLVRTAANGAGRNRGYRESEMIRNIVRIVEGICGPQGHFPKDLGSKLIAEDFLTVNRELQQFVLENRIQVPSRLQKLVAGTSKIAKIQSPFGKKVFNTGAQQTQIYQPLIGQTPQPQFIPSTGMEPRPSASHLVYLKEGSNPHPRSIPKITFSHKPQLPQPTTPRDAPHTIAQFNTQSSSSLVNNRQGRFNSALRREVSGQKIVKM